MKKIFAALFNIAILFCVNATAQDVSVIQQQEITRLLRTLSADSMRGRATFTPYINKAADFIADEFRRTGLQPLPGNSGFKQTFNIYNLKPEEQNVQLNRETIPAENIFALTNYEELQWKHNAKRSVEVIGKNADFQGAFGRIKDLEDDVLVLVHPAHQKAFSSYQKYISEGSTGQVINKGHNKVFVLTPHSLAKSYSIEIEHKVERHQLANVVGVVEGKRKDEVVVFSAHYDHIGILDAVNGDSIANGADDDASGTTAVMMLARYYKQQPQPERTLLFVAFTAEEVGGFGSRYFSEQLNPDQIVAMFNIEMIGKPSKFGANSAYLTGFEKSDLGKLMQQRLKGTPYRILPDPYPEQNLFYRSDNATLARLGVPAHTISSVQIDKDKTYHTVDDEFEKLDLAHMTSMIKAIALASRGVVSGEDTPKRVDKTTVR